MAARMSAPSLLFVLGVQALAAPADSFEFREIARVPYTAAARVTCGDADHDGRPEIYTYSFPSPIHEVICEFWPDMRYDTTRVDIEQPRFWFTADVDRDGRTEVGLTRYDSTGHLSLFESPDSFSLPTRLVWQTSGETRTTCVMSPADLDADSALEVVCMKNCAGSIYVYECVGDDSLAFRATMPEPLGPYYDEFGVCPDLDRDGKPELLAGITELPLLYVFEAVAPGVDSFHVVRTLPLPMGPNPHVDAVVGGPDIDRDGRTEAIVLAVDGYSNGLLAVYESPCDDSFDMVWHEFLPVSYIGFHYIAVGDVDGDTVPEFLATDGRDVLLYRCTGDDQYERFGQITTWCPEAGLCDLNCDGKAEVVACVQGHQTAIYQYVEVGLAEQERRAMERAVPTLCRGVLRLPASGERRVAGVELLDVTGRKVMALHAGDNDVRCLPPGAYFLRSDSGRVGKLLLVE